MTEKIYKQPLVKRVDGTSIDFGYFTWLRSRKEIILDENKISFFKDIKFSNTWLNEVPNNFYVGDELVNKYEYKKRVNRMNLQYTNIEYFIFEIQGSALFRDLVFNINMHISPSWSVSNRFLFSILDNDAVYNSENYHISEEYKGIKEWEDQFDKYMDAIKQNRKTDINRLEMPYSISSEFWVGINKRNLLSFLKMLKEVMPFFYKIYGIQFMMEIGIDESDLPNNIGSDINQYFRTPNTNNVEGVREIDDDIYVTSQMSLILYSQFIRQSSTKVKGLLNQLIHEDEDSFKSRVFKGSTTFLINFNADKTKVHQTVSNRLCAFAMSSGSGPDSWSYFLNNFIPGNFSARELMKLLPCKFYEDKATGEVKLTHCKFFDDVKFRNEGKEISNCPCPLIDINMKNAQWKKEVDNNRIGDAYFELTKLLKYGGLEYEYKNEFWTSELQILTKSPLDTKITDWIEYQLNLVSNKFKDGVLLNEKMGDQLLPYQKYGLNNDVTCLMKGWAIDLISRHLKEANYSQFLISFGGDIFGYKVASVITVEDTNLDLSLNGIFSVFTSGNTNKRGNHIVGGTEGEKSVTIAEWSYLEYVNNILVDALSTKHFSKEVELESEIKSNIWSRVHFIDLDKDGKIKNPTYCASPFFNPEQIRIRDKMISNFTDVFRPDLTPSSKEYDANHNEFAEAVVGENLIGIEEAEMLVYPTATDDLGTLYEVGHAISLGRPVIKYDNRLTFMIIDDMPLIEQNKQYLFDCSDKINAVTMGYVSGLVPKENIFYQLKGSRDNIMLSVKYTHIELDGDKYKIILRDENDRDK